MFDTEECNHSSGSMIHTYRRTPQKMKSIACRILRLREIQYTGIGMELLSDSDCSVDEELCQLGKALCLTFRHDVFW